MSKEETGTSDRAHIDIEERKRRESQANLIVEEDGERSISPDDEWFETVKPEKTQKTKVKKAKPKKVVVPRVPIYKLFHFATPADSILLFFGFLSAAGHGTVMPAFSIIFGKILDSFNVNDPEEMYNQIVDFALWFIWLGIMTFGVASGHQICFKVAATRQIKRLREAYLSSILRQDIAWFDKNGTGALVQRISGDTEIISEAIGDKLGEAIRFLSMFVAGFVIGFTQGWKMSLVLVAVTPLLAISGGAMMRIMASLTQRGQAAYADAGSVATEVISGIKTVASFNGHAREVERYGANLQKATRLGIRRGFASGLGIGITMCVLFCSWALALWYGGQLVIKEGYSGGTVLTVFFSILMGAFSLGQASPSIQKLSEAQGAAATLFETVERKPQIDATADVGETIKDFKGNISLKSIKFHYPTRAEVKVLDDLNITIKEGQMVALVGSSGCGKSSTISLIQRFYDTVEGQVLIDGIDIKTLNLKWWRQQIGLVSQEPVLFAGTIAENIAYGKPGASLEEIQEAAKLSNAHNFISEFPDGYNTFVGEKGAQLSGGQKQRIAIARAIIKNPKLLLLDEATSALDSESEKIVQDALDKVMKGRTTIVIAHRLSTIRDANVIFVMNKGKVVESGTHEELMANTIGHYSELVRLQGGGNSEYLEKLGKKQKTKVNEVQKKNQTEKEEKKGEKEAEYKVPLSRILRLNKSELGWILIACFMSAINGSINPVFSVIYSELVGLYYLPATELQNDLKFWVGMFVLLGFVALIANVLSAGLFGLAGERLTKRLRLLAFRSIIRQDMSFFDEEKHLPSILTTNLATDATLVHSLVGNRIGIAFQNLVSIIAGLIIAFIAGWKLTLVVLAIAPVIAFSGAMRMLSMRGFAKKDKEALANANQLAAESIGNMRTVAAFTGETYVKDKFSHLLLEPYKIALKKDSLNGVLVGLGEGLLFLGYALAFWFGGREIRSGNVDFVDVLKVFMAIVMSAASIGQTTALAPDAKKAEMAASSLFSIIDKVPIVDPFSKEGKSLNVKGNIKLENIEFNYPSRPDAKIFTELNLNIKAGQMVALVGPSGCGKSSIVALLERFYIPTSGKIEFDGEDIKDLSVSELRKTIGLVSQEPVLFAGTIAENIAYGKPGASLEEIQEAAKASNAHKFISEFPDGYNTNVGEKGTQISGGQKQRIAIARAIIKNPSIFLLDEATSALDTESEKIVQDALDRVMKGRTTIVIAHRLSTIRHADMIAVINGGKVAESGTHDELMKQEGIYFSLVARQQR